MRTNGFLLFGERRVFWAGAEAFTFAEDELGYIKKRKCSGERERGCAAMKASSVCGLLP